MSRVKPVSTKEWLEAIKVAQPGLQRQAVMIDMIDSTDDDSTGIDVERYIKSVYTDDFEQMYIKAEKDLGLLPTSLCDDSELQSIYRVAVDNVANIL